LRARQHPVDPTATDIAAPRDWSFDCRDGDGRTLLRVRGMVNLYFRVTPSYHSARLRPLTGWLGGPVGNATPAGVVLWQLPMLPEDLSTQSGGICLRVMAQVVLAPAERGEWRALRGSLRHRREWLYGRAALKEAVRHWVYEQTGELLYLTDVRVDHDSSGAPHVGGDWEGTLIEAPQVSAHLVHGVKIAAVAPPGRPVGVDLENVARVREPSLFADSFAPEERAWLEGLEGLAPAERVLRLWCAKEAAAKCLGTGLQGRPEAFRVVAADAACTKLLVDSDWGAVETRIHQDGGTIIAVAMQEAGDTEVHR
jgi:phosphopantetheinyl transferase (holo-ACP synthase)